MLFYAVRKKAMRRLRATALAGFATTALAGAATAAIPASAVAADAGATAAECTSTDALCLFEGENFTGEVFSVRSVVAPGTCVSLAEHGWGDRAHSAINTLEDNAAMFMNDDCLGDPFPIPPNGSMPSFGSFTPESVWVPNT